MAERHPDGPRVLVQTPDGSTVPVRLIAWHRWPGHSEWWAQCSITLWMRTQEPYVLRADPYDVEFYAPSSKGRVTKIEGEDYRAVPRVKHRTQAAWGDDGSTREPYGASLNR
jgi:hypothetical protein